MTFRSLLPLGLAVSMLLVSGCGGASTDTVGPTVADTAASPARESERPPSSTAPSDDAEPFAAPAESPREAVGRVASPTPAESPSAEPAEQPTRSEPRESTQPPTPRGEPADVSPKPAPEAPPANEPASEAPATVTPAPIGATAAVGTTGEARRPAASERPENLHEPEVILSAGHLSTCRVHVGEPFPDLMLQDTQGAMTPLASQHGDRLTIVVFWNAENIYAREQFMRLEREVVEPYASFGASVVAINVGDAPAEVASLLERSGFTGACLLDQDGDAFGQVATAKLPRVYLLDAAGKILWLDIEYSRSTRRELHNAVHWALRGDS